mgnify:CR=1 FL=1
MLGDLVLDRALRVSCRDLPLFGERLGVGLIKRQAVKRAYMIAVGFRDRPTICGVEKRVKMGGVVANEDVTEPTLGSVLLRRPFQRDQVGVAPGKIAVPPCGEGAVFRNVGGVVVPTL